MEFDLKAGIALGAILVAIVTAYLANWWRNRRQISFEIVSENSLISEGIASDKEDLKIYYHGDFVRNVRLVVVRVANTGNQPILAGDFEQPLDIDFGPNTRVLSAEKAAARPPEFDLRFRTGVSSIEFEPSLINPKDRFDIKLLIEAEKISLSAKARIAGVTTVRDLSKNRGSRLPGAIYDTLLPPAVLAYGIFLLTLPSWEWMAYFSIGAGILSLLATILKRWDPFNRGS